MIDFSTLKGLTIPEGNVTQIESDGVILWKAVPTNVTIAMNQTDSVNYSPTAEPHFTVNNMTYT